MSIFVNRHKLQKTKLIILGKLCLPVTLILGNTLFTHNHLLILHTQIIGLRHFKTNNFWWYRWCLRWCKQWFPIVCMMYALVTKMWVCVLTKVTIFLKSESGIWVEIQKMQGIRVVMQGIKVKIRYSSRNDIEKQWKG